MKRRFELNPLDGGCWQLILWESNPTTGQELQMGGGIFGNSAGDYDDALETGQHWVAALTSIKEG